jgi:hypothetical protein
LGINLVNAYRTHEGQDLKGIRRTLRSVLRDQRLLRHDANKVLVIAGEFYLCPLGYALFDLEELLIVRGRELESCLTDSGVSVVSIPSQKRLNPYGAISGQCASVDTAGHAVYRKRTRQWRLHERFVGLLEPVEVRRWRRR